MRRERIKGEVVDPLYLAHAQKTSLELFSGH